MCESKSLRLMELFPSNLMSASTGWPSNGCEGVAQAASRKRAREIRAKRGRRWGGGRSTVNRGRSTAVSQQQMQVRLLPGARPLVAGEAPLRRAEFGPVHGAAAVAFEAGRGDLGEDLVEDDHLDEAARPALASPARAPERACGAAGSAAAPARGGS